MTTFQGYLDSIRREQNLTAERESELVRQMHDGDTRAREALIRAHMKLVVKLARSYGGYGHSLEDLVSCGSIGLAKAVDRFREGVEGTGGRITRLNTYAAWWIKSELSQFVLDNASPTKIGTNAKSKRLFFRLSRELAKLGVLDSSRISADQAEQVAAALDVTADEVLEMAARLRSSPSLDAPVHRDDAEGETFASLIADDAPSVEERLADQQEHDLGMAKVNAALAQLSERDRDIVLARLADEKSTLGDLAEKYGLSRERIRQRQSRAYDKLKSEVLGTPLKKLPPRKKRGATEDAAPVGRTRTCTSCRTVKPARSFGREQSRCRECSRFATKMRALTQKLTA